MKKKIIRFKDWPEKKIAYLLRIYPYYNKNKLANIMNCTVEVIKDFENEIMDSQNITITLKKMMRLRHK